MGKLEFVVFTSLWFSSLLHADSYLYPSIDWNPWNPIFACDEPEINVRIGDAIKFICPSNQFSFLAPYSRVRMIYENLYFLGTDKRRYDECDATGMHKLLNCDDQPNTIKHYEFVFHSLKTSEDSLEFVRGNTYYLIGTGFRDVENLSNNVNGSCRKVNDEGPFRMRLKVYVCTDDEISSGKCDICTSSACYYQGCNAECTSWASIGILKSDQECMEMQKRSCKYPLVSQDEKEEFQNITVQCQEPVKQNTTEEPVKSKSTQSRAEPINTYIIVAVGFAGLFLGFILGIALYRIYLEQYKRKNKKKYPKENHDDDDDDLNGKFNETYKYSMEIKDVIIPCTG